MGYHVKFGWNVHLGDSLTDPKEYLLPSKANALVRLESHDGVLRYGDDAYPTTVTPVLRLQPTPEVVFSGPVESDDHPLSFFGKLLDDRQATLELAGGGDGQRVLLRSFSSETGFQGVLKSGFLLGGGQEPADRVLFHLLNFPGFLVQREGRARKNELRLEDSEHVITIEPAEDFDVELAVLKDLGGYSVTHWGTLERRDGGKIDVAAAREALRLAHSFLSFARGSWCGLSLAIGVSAEGSKVWTEFGNRMVDEWKSYTSWFDRHNGQALEASFSGFSDRWNDPTSRDLLTTCIYWYLRSNGPAAGVDGGLILTQAALERMSWVRLVDEWRALSPAGFGKLSAHDRLRLLLSRMDVPLDIPEPMGELKDLARELNWDGPSAVAEIRNQLVHPTAQGRLRGRKLPYYQAWNLAQWYLELSLLHIVRFDSVYADRTRLGGWVGDATSPPWS